MHETAASTTSASAAAPAAPARRFRWRVVDIVVASVIGVALGIVYWAYGAAWGPISAPIEALLPGLQAGPAALWVIAGVMGALVIRKPGAAIYTEVVAATVSALVGTQWGLLTLEAGLVQGLGAEIVFLLFAYRVWNPGVAVLAGAGAGAAMALNDLLIYYPGASSAFTTIYAVASVVGGSLIAGLLAWVAVRGLASTGALSSFASGRTAKLAED
ncbi:ECF transporter S component [Agromyces archimandritae]|uniref:ECF transporter S component n=1 Tax=Agromyces archimandritae TaxID=2781962 RepID=A0A975FMN5_9MICO|nr:ECF transporter S component [Agromyces archimandritae]QTX04517.1 ECF transporter S component [Agromyces archimandritae]